MSENKIVIGSKEYTQKTLEDARQAYKSGVEKSKNATTRLARESAQFEFAVARGSADNAAKAAAKLADSAESAEDREQYESMRRDAEQLRDQANTVLCNGIETVLTSAGPVGSKENPLRYTGMSGSGYQAIIGSANEEHMRENAEKCVIAHMKADIVGQESGERYEVTENRWSKGRSPRYYIDAKGPKGDVLYSSYVDLGYGKLYVQNAGGDYVECNDTPETFASLRVIKKR